MKIVNFIILFLSLFVIADTNTEGYYAEIHGNQIHDKRDQEKADELIKKFAQLNKSSVVGPGVVPGEFVRTGKAFESIDSQKAIARSAEWVGPTLPPDQQQEQQAKDDMRIRSSWSASSLTANQQVGAFVAAQPIVLTEIKEQTKVLRDIRKLAESIDDKS